MSETEALKSLGAFPLVQGALFVMVVLAGIWVFLRGGRDSGKSGGGDHAQGQIPQWVMMGPVHDALGAIHDMAEQSRQQRDLLERMETHLGHAVDSTRNSTAILEAIRNESRLR